MHSLVVLHWQGTGLAGRMYPVYHGDFRKGFSVVLLWSMLCSLERPPLKTVQWTGNKKERSRVKSITAQALQSTAGGWNSLPGSCCCVDTVMLLSEASFYRWSAPSDWDTNCAMWGHLTSPSCCSSSGQTYSYLLSVSTIYSYGLNPSFSPQQSTLTESRPTSASWLFLLTFPRGS